MKLSIIIPAYNEEKTIVEIVNKLDEIDLNKEYKGQDLINNLRARSYKDRSYVYYIQNGKCSFLNCGIQ